ncbi:MAG: HD domain-containing protein [Paenibacillaceae bacterium]
MRMIEKAIKVAAIAHKNQKRKGTEIPYITHPYAVGMILAQAGCNEEVIVAGILHDTIEDTEIDIHYIAREFGSNVALIVEGCSEPNKELTWEERKKHTILYLKTAHDEVKMVASADKLHNLRCMNEDYRQLGEDLWSRFQCGRIDQEWYYRNLLKSLSFVPTILLNELIYEFDQLFSTDVKLVISDEHSAIMNGDLKDRFRYQIEQAKEERNMWQHQIDRYEQELACLEKFE